MNRKIFSGTSLILVIIFLYGCDLFRSEPEKMLFVKANNTTSEMLQILYAKDQQGPFMSMGGIPPNTIKTFFNTPLDHSTNYFLNARLFHNDSTIASIFFVQTDENVEIFNWTIQ